MPSHKYRKKDKSSRSRKKRRTDKSSRSRRVSKESSCKNTLKKLRSIAQSRANKRSRTKALREAGLL